MAKFTQCVLALLLLAANGPALAQASRAERLDRLQDGILAAASATQFLTTRCAELHLADPAVVKAEVTPDARGTATVDIRTRLKVAGGEPLRYRRVRLTCGGHVLSVAENWYVPSRLTPEMNASLDGSDTPFGTVVKPLNFHRRTVEMATPLDRAALERAGRNSGDAARLKSMTVFQLEAVLLTPQEVPISLVIENYQGELLDDPTP